MGTIEKINGRNVKEGAYGSYAGDVAVRVLVIEIAVDRVEGMYGIGDAAKVERDVEILTAGHGPILGARIVDGALYSAVDGVADFTGHLGEGEAGVDDGHEPTFGCLWNHGLDGDGLTVGADDAYVLVGEDLPMLVLVYDAGDLVDLELGHVRDVL